MNSVRGSPSRPFYLSEALCFGVQYCTLDNSTLHMLFNEKPFFYRDKQERKLLGITRKAKSSIRKAWPISIWRQNRPEQGRPANTCSRNWMQANAARLFPILFVRILQLKVPSLYRLNEACFTRHDKAYWRFPHVNWGKLKFLVKEYVNCTSHRAYLLCVINTIQAYLC